MLDDDHIALAATDMDRCGISTEICLSRKESKNVTKYLREADKRIRKRIKIFKYGRKKP